MRKHHSEKSLYKSMIIVALVLLFVGAMAGLLWLERPPENMRTRRQESLRTAEPVDWESLTKVKLNHTTYALLHDVTTWLVIGTDASGNPDGIGKDYQGAMADFLLLAVVDEKEKSFGMIQLNRDTITEIRLLDYNGEGEATANIQLCTAHWYGGSRQQGCENTVYAVSKLLGGIPIDGYYEIPMRAIPLLNSQVGGVTVTLTDDFSSVDTAMKKGEQITLNDSQAYHYVHDRYGVGDEENTSRMRRQRQYMHAFSEKVLQKGKEDKHFASRLFRAMDAHVISEIDNKCLVQYMQSMEDFQSRGVYTPDGTVKTGQALGDGLEHREFYPDASSVEEIMTALYPLQKIPS